MTDIAIKSAKQVAHEQRNAAAKASAIQAKIDRYLAHVERQNQKAIAAAAARSARRNMDETAALADATRAYADAVEARFGIASNDNAAIAKAA